MQTILDNIKKVKEASYGFALLDETKRNAILHTLAQKLRHSHAAILAANAKDLTNMDPSSPIYDRLLLNTDRLNGIATDIENVINLTSSINKQLESTKMPNGLVINKVCVPLGVVAVIYESRPNVTLDVFVLCCKTSNACILKGGKEAFNTNECLFNLIQDTLAEHNINPNVAYLMPPNREDSTILLNAVGLVDVCIPRGGQALIDYVRNNSKIPVIETGAGIVHAYFDKDGEVNIGRDIINNSKTRRVSVCNALDCLLIHKERLNDLPILVDLLKEHNVVIYADPEAYAALAGNYPANLLCHAEAADFGKEFLDYKLAIKTVASIDAAIEHIIAYSSQHSEAIITQNSQTASYFTQRVDAAVVYVNASTAFTDGAQFGLGAEIGISTQKLHARGPMALDALTSYKWIVQGTGQIRGS
jgi:glutamate-5-semialdehyde dehydrogenase